MISLLVCQVSVAWGKTYVLIINDNTISILGVNTVSGTNPSLPENGINPSKADLLAVGLVHVDANSLGLAQGTLVTAIVSLVNAKLLGITELLSFMLEQKNLLVHPLVGGALQLALGSQEAFLVLSVDDAENDDLAIHDLTGIGGRHLRNNWQPDRLHPVQNAVDVAHLLGCKRLVVCWATFSGNEKAGPGGNLIAGEENGILGLHELSLADQAERQALERHEVLAGSSMVVEVDEDDLLLLLEDLQGFGIHVLNAVADIDSLLGVVHEVAEASKPVVLDTLTALEEKYGGITTEANILAKPGLDIAIHFSNVQLPLHLLGQLLPVRRHGLAMVAPRCVELDEPRILGHGDKRLELLRGKGHGNTLLVGGYGGLLDNGLRGRRDSLLCSGARLGLRLNGIRLCICLGIGLGIGLRIALGLGGLLILCRRSLRRGLFLRWRLGVGLLIGLCGGLGVSFGVGLVVRSFLRVIGLARLLAGRVLIASFREAEASGSRSRLGSFQVLFKDGADLIDFLDALDQFGDLAVLVEDGAGVRLNIVGSAKVKVCHAVDCGEAEVVEFRERLVLGLGF